MSVNLFVRLFVRSFVRVPSTHAVGKHSPSPVCAPCPAHSIPMFEAWVDLVSPTLGEPSARGYDLIAEFEPHSAERIGLHTGPQWCRTCKRFTKMVQNTVVQRHDCGFSFSITKHIFIDIPMGPCKHVVSNETQTCRQDRSSRA